MLVLYSILVYKIILVLVVVHCRPMVLVFVFVPHSSQIAQGCSRQRLIDVKNQLKLTLRL